MSSKLLNIVVSGVGGQGTVLAGKLLSQAALLTGAFVRSAETIGMAQRGGSVLGHVRIAGSEEAFNPSLHSPLVSKGEADLLIGFEPGETLKAYAFCRRGALVVTATKPLPPPTASLQRLDYNGRAQLEALAQELSSERISQLLLIENDELLGKLGFEKALNVVLLGAALGALESATQHWSGFLGYETMQQAIRTTVRPQFVEPNIQALEMGYQLACR